MQLDVHRYYCSLAEDQLAILHKSQPRPDGDHAQTILDRSEAPRLDVRSSQGLWPWWDWNCATLDLARGVFPTKAFTPRHWPDIPLTLFMLHAAPEAFISWSVRTFGRWLGWEQHTVEHWQKYLNTFEVLGPSLSPWVWEVRSVPGTTAAVKAESLWIQAPSEKSDSALLVGVWKVSKDGIPAAFSKFPLSCGTTHFSSRYGWMTTGTRLM